MHIVFCAAPMSSATPVATVLNELQVPHERVMLDLSKNEQKKPAFLQLNPNGKVPTLVVDGTPLFEALAIMQWLGDRFGVERGLWPRFEDGARFRALSWTTWSYVTFSAAVQRYNLAQGPNVDKAWHSPALAKAAHEDLQQLLGILDQQLGKHAHLLGEPFSLADLIVGNVVAWAKVSGISSEGQPKVKAWAERILQRPSIQAEWGPQR